MWARILGEIRRLSPQKGYFKFESRLVRHRVPIISNLSQETQLTPCFRLNIEIFAQKGSRREFSVCASCSKFSSILQTPNSADPFDLTASFGHSNAKR